MQKGIKEDIDEAKGMKNCGCGKNPCETYGVQKEEGRWDETDQGRAY